MRAVPSTCPPQRRDDGALRTRHDLADVITEGAGRRIRPMLMTGMALPLGLVPFLWSDGSGADVMKRIAVLLAILSLSVILPEIIIAAQSHHGVGTVETIDVKKRKIELVHGPIKSIGWMAMKMTFDVEERDLLEDIEVGDKVGFEFIKTRDGRFVIIDVEPLD